MHSLRLSQSLSSYCTICELQWVGREKENWPNKCNIVFKKIKIFFRNHKNLKLISSGQNLQN